MRRTLSKAPDDAMRRQRIRRSPVALAHTPRYELPEIEPLTTAEAQRIVNAVSTEPDGAAFVLAISLGLRRGEELGLKWDDVDVDAGRLEVRRRLERRRWQHGCMNLQAPPAVLASWVRDHRTVGNKLHRVRDVVLDEDRSRVRTGTRPPVMASLRTAAINAPRLIGTHGVAATPRRDARNPEQAITCTLTC